MEFLYTSLKKKYGWTPVPYGEVRMQLSCGSDVWYVVFIVFDLALANLLLNAWNGCLVLTLSPPFPPTHTHSLPLQVVVFSGATAILLHKLR